MASLISDSTYHVELGDAMTTAPHVELGDAMTTPGAQSTPTLGIPGISGTTTPSTFGSTSVTPVASAVGPTVSAPSNTTVPSFGSLGFTIASAPAGSTSSGGTSGSTTQTNSGVSVGGTYTIQSGDTLGAIAKRYGTTVEVLADLNGITDPNRIYAGKTLKLPGGSTTPAETPAVAAPVPAQVVTDPEGTDPIVVDNPVASSDDATGTVPVNTDGVETNTDSTNGTGQTDTDQDADAGTAPGAGTAAPGSQTGEDNRNDAANDALANGGNEDQENNAGGAEGVDDGFPGSSVGEEHRSDEANDALADSWEGDEEDGSVMPDDVITPDDPVAEAGTEPTPGTGMHIVMPGDTLSDIAQYYGTDVDTLVRLNNVENRNLIHPGQVLQLPDGAAAGSVGAGTDESAGTYTVVVGDTLSAIAEKHGYGGDYMSLAKENNLANPDLILPGQKLAFGGASTNGLPDNTLPEATSIVGYTEQS
ncbi:MAG: LysM peptidoglycan-binding domain-containing protein [Candidatus Saccharimonadales bacterium]